MNERQEQNEQQAATACTNTDNLFAGELLTLDEVSKILKVSRKTLYAWKAQGKIRFLKIAGTLVRIQRSDLTAIVTRNENPGATPAIM